jgi:hypothetical protein
MSTSKGAGFLNAQGAVTLALDTVLWGTGDVDTVVWGTSDGDTVVWGTRCTDSSCQPVTRKRQ